MKVTSQILSLTSLIPTFCPAKAWLRLILRLPRQMRPQWVIVSGTPWGPCYKPSTRFPNLREVLMRNKNRRRANDQRELFPAPALLQWSDVPAAMRARTVALLAPLLRQHVRACRATEAPDE